MPRYNHAFDFAFEVKTDNAADDVTPAELRAALIARAQSISDSEIMEACGCFDTMEESRITLTPGWSQAWGGQTV